MNVNISNQRNTQTNYQTKTYYNLRIISINVCGLKSKVTCPEFISLIENHDIICVQESKLDDVDCVQINGFTVYTNNRKKITRYRSGGIALIIRNSILSHIEILKNESKLISWMKISKDLLLSNEDVYLGIIYNPPYRSKYAQEDPYLEIQLELDRVCSNRKNILLCGDWNSRTSTLNDYIPVDYFMSDHFGNFDLMNENDEILDCLYNNNVPLSSKILTKRQMYTVIKC